MNNVCYYCENFPGSCAFEIVFPVEICVVFQKLFIYSLRIFLYEFQVLVTQQIDLMTAKAWLSADKQLERKVGYLVRQMIELGCV